MSTILKALRKLEQDKLREGKGRSEIAFDILKTSPRSRRIPAFPALATGAVLVLAAAALLYLAVAPQPANVASDKPAAAASSSIGTAGKDGGVAEPPVRLPETVPEPEQAPRAETKRVTKAAQASIAEAADAVPPSRPVAEQGRAAEPRWVVSGIAWQEVGDQRLAVINGLPVMTGTAIDDATVVAIEKDRVVLSSGGEEITVALKLPQEE